MYRRVLAFDFDGTLAENGIVPLALQTALERLHAAGYALFMVTGRRFADAELGSLGDVFTGIIWENGAVLHHTTTDKVYLPSGHIDPRLARWAFDSVADRIFRAGRGPKLAGTGQVRETQSAYHYLLMRWDPHSYHPLSNMQAPEGDLGGRVL